MKRDLESTTTLNRSLQLEAVELKKRIAELEAALQQGGGGKRGVSEFGEKMEPSGSRQSGYGQVEGARAAGQGGEEKSNGAEEHRHQHHHE